MTSTTAPAPPSSQGQGLLRIGVDVGGTNTDGVVLDPAQAAAGAPGRGVVAWHKTPTTADPSQGIGAAIAAMLREASVAPDRVASVTIGTTHFVNAVIARDAARLAPVAVLRLCGPFSKHVPPCVDWPADLRALVLGHHTLVRGGLGVEGEPLFEDAENGDIDEAAIRAECAAIRAKGIQSVVVNGVFSPIDSGGLTGETQEARAATVVREEVPGCDVVCARDVANLGFLERENAAVLNAAILPFARRTIRAFRQPVRHLGLRCPVFVTQNDGTILPGDAAARLPVRTFASGPTNSMRGAAFLMRGERQGQDTKEDKEDIMVVDIGGTTTDVGLLLANGFPRQQAVFSELGGVRVNFSCPDVKSIGLGGGSIVRSEAAHLTVGPDSVGYRLTKEALVFGGKTLTATDCTVLASDVGVEAIGDPALASGALSAEGVARFRDVVRQKLEKVIDTMKTSPDDVPVLLVGGGAVVAPGALKGASRVIRPPWAAVANAIGASTARVSAVVDTVKSTESRSTQALLDEIAQEAIERTVAAGASRTSVEVVEMDALPLPYVANQTRFIVRAAGDFDYSRTDLTTADLDDGDEDAALETDLQDTTETEVRARQSAALRAQQASEEDVDIDTYRPAVRNRVWYVSETDLAWLSTGCYILGTGGGGSPYSSMIRLREMLRAGAVVRVVSPEDVPDGAAVGCGCGAGSPTVGVERLAGDEMLEAQRALYRVCGTPATHLVNVEVGGGNGLQSLILGADTQLDLPAVDGDWMGRAYPTKWQTTPVVSGERPVIWAPVAMADGAGNVVVMPRASSDKQVERILRAALAQMGSAVGCADAPVTGAECRRWAVAHTLSQAWRIGRAVARARRARRVAADAAETILAECGGPTTGRVLWKGKVVGVERLLRGGYVYGELIIEGADLAGDEEAQQQGQEPGSGEGKTPSSSSFQGLLKIPFKNENIAAIRITRGKKGEGANSEVVEKEEEVLGSVPDLICVIDAQNGEAIGTPEYRYGLLVVVLGIAASDHWTTERGLEIGGPKGFGMDHLTYKPLGKYVKPRSVIDEFDVSE